MEVLITLPLVAGHWVHVALNESIFGIIDLGNTKQYLCAERLGAKFEVSLGLFGSKAALSDSEGAQVLACFLHFEGD